MVIVRIAASNVEGRAGYLGSGEKRKEKEVIVKRRRRDPNWKIGMVDEPPFWLPRPCYGYDNSLNWQYPHRYGAKSTDGGSYRHIGRNDVPLALLVIWI